MGTMGILLAFSCAVKNENMKLPRKSSFPPLHLSFVLRMKGYWK